MIDAKDNVNEILRVNLEHYLNARNLKQADLARGLGVSEATISKWLSGKSSPRMKKIDDICKILDVKREDLLYEHDFVEEEPIAASNLYTATIREFPLLGTIAAGQPIFAEETVPVPISGAVGIDADFCLKVQGDSMINAKINDSDIVFIRKQSMVEDGEIAAVLISELYGDTATLKRVYYDKEENKIQLIAENPKYPPLTFSGEKLNDIRILGKAVALQTPL